MFSVCIKLLTLVTFAGHVIVGCCAHHAHAHEECHENHESGVAIVHHDGHEHVHHSHEQHGHEDAVPTAEDSDEPASSEHEHPENCHEDDCKYVADRDVTLPIDLFSGLDNWIVEIPVQTTTALEASLVVDPDRPLGIVSADCCAQWHRWQV